MDEYIQESHSQTLYRQRETREENRKESQAGRSSEFAFSTNADFFSLSVSPLLSLCLSQGLPDDRVSLTNGVLVSYLATKLDRSPLLIDPQQQAKKWIKNKEAESNLRLLSLSHPKLQKILSSAIRLGQPVLVSLSLFPAENLLLLSFYFLKYLQREI